MQRNRLFTMLKAAISLILAICMFLLLSLMPIDLTGASVIAASLSFMTPIPKVYEVYDGTEDVQASVLEENAEKSDNTKIDASVNVEIKESASEIEKNSPQNTINITLPTALSEEINSISPVVAQPNRPANSGMIIKKLYLQNDGSIDLNKGFLKNCTVKTPKQILEIAKQPPKFKIKTDKTPQVLIMHTHTTESYQTSADWFIKGESSRTTDLSRNTVAVGEEIKKALEAVNIGVIHDKTLHDYPSYNGAYERSAVTVKKLLKQYPSIKVVLDVHRDAIQPSNDTIIAPTAQINGKSCAQVMIIAGCEKENGSMGLPKYKENLKLACALQREMAGQYKDLCRPILFDYRKYNQDLTTGSLLLEMGGHGNTLEEALYCGELVGKSLANTLLKLK